MRDLGKLKGDTMSNEALKPYANMLKAWPRECGHKPTAEQLDTIHKLGARPGKQALANAMALRDSGVTAAQIIMACGAPQLNKMRGFVADKLAKFEAMPFADNGHKVYRIALTEKGKAKVAKAGETPAEAPAKKAKGTGKRKAKVTPKAEVPASDADVTTEAVNAAPALTGPVDGGDMQVSG